MEDQSTIRNELKNELTKRGITLCIGSGVTSSYVGDWKSLICRLFQQRCYDRYCEEMVDDKEDQQKKMHRDLQNLEFKSANHISPVEFGEYLLLDAHDLSDDIKDEATRKLWREVYLASQIQILMPDMKQSIKEIVDNYNPFINTLDAVLTLCLRRLNTSTPIQHLITYNYDTVIDECLRSRAFLKKVYQSCNYEPPTIQVYSNPDEAIPFVCKGEKKINIYHVHGMLTENDSPAPVVFSESSYDLLTEQQYAWANQIQAELYLRFPLLFVGFSGHDPNFRRLLKAITRGNKIPCSYLFLRISDLEDMLIVKKRCHIGADAKNLASRVLRETTEYYYKEMYNIKVIWYSNYSEIAEFLMFLAD